MKYYSLDAANGYAKNVSVDMMDMIGKLSAPMSLDEAKNSAAESALIFSSEEGFYHLSLIEPRHLPTLLRELGDGNPLTCVCYRVNFGAWIGVKNDRIS